MKKRPAKYWHGWLRKSFLMLLTVSLMIAGTLSPAAAVVDLPRISGSDRYMTAIEVSKKGWPQGANTVILTRGDNYADALAGVPLAYALDAPILLTSTLSLNKGVKAEIVRLGVSKAVILGGESAVSAAIELELEAMPLDVERIFGSCRYETAAAIANRLAPNGADTAVMAFGGDFPDALAAASYAAVEGYPILLTRTDSIPQPTQEALNLLEVNHTIVVGGVNVISEKVFSLLPEAERVAGADRYATSVALAYHFQPASSHMFIASGLDFPDAITGAVLAAKHTSGILLVKNNDIPKVVEDYISYTQQLSYPLSTHPDENWAQSSSFKLLSSSTVTHRVSNNILYGLDFSGRAVPITTAPSFLPPGDYHVNNDFDFYLLLDPNEPQLKGNFNYYTEKPYALLPLNRPADPKVTAAFLEEQAHRIRANSPLAELGQVFIMAQEKWGVNALYLMAHAALESGWGTSEIFRDKNNMFGYGAYDSSPYSGAYYFSSPEECILWVSAIVRRNYLTEGGVYFYGPHVKGMNVNYATDPMWDIKIANIMENILSYENYEPVERELNRGRVNVSELRLRETPSLNGEIIGSLPLNTELEIEGMKVVGSHNWLKVRTASDSGWVSGVYVDLLTEPTAAVFHTLVERREVEGDRQVNLTLRLNIYAGPGTGHAQVGSLPFAAGVVIKEMKMVDSDVWYRVEHAKIGSTTILGGEKVVSPEVENRLAQLTQEEGWVEGKLASTSGGTKRKVVIIDW